VQANAITLGAYRFDARRQRLAIGDREQRLTEKETQLLRLLCLHRDRVLDRALALREIWGDDSYHCGRSMDVFISRLRRHLARDDRISIKAVHGRGSG
jgi:DNA-binding response OmpR family regulator